MIYVEKLELTIKMAFKTILLHHNVHNNISKSIDIDHNANMNTGPIGFILLAIDDIGGIIADQDNESGFSFLKVLTNSIGELLISGYQNYMITSLITGTIFQPVQTGLKSSSHPFVSLPVPLFNLTISYNLANNILFNELKSTSYESLYDTIINSIQYQLLLADIGGIPRYITKLVAKIISNLKDFNTIDEFIWIDIKNEIFSEIKNRYYTYGYPLIMKELVANIMTKDSKLIGSLIEYKDLQDNGYVFIDEKKSILTIPFVILYGLCLNGKEFGFPSATRKLITFVKDMKNDWKDFIIFNAMFQCMLLTYYSQKKDREHREESNDITIGHNIDISTYFHGAIIGQNLLNQSISIPQLNHHNEESVNVIVANHRFPETSVLTFLRDSIELEIPLNGKYVIINANDAMSDVINVHPVVNHSKPILIFIHLKHTNIEDIIQNIINNEKQLTNKYCYEKEKKSVRKGIANNSESEMKPYSSIIHVIITNKRFDEKLNSFNYPNIILITFNELESFFTKTFADRFDILRKYLLKEEIFINN